VSLSRILAVNEDPEVGDLRRVGGEGDGLGLERSSPWRLPLDEPVSPINLSWAAAMRRTGTGLFPARLQATEEAADLFVCANPTGMTAAARKKQLHLAKISVRDRSGLCFTPNAFA